MPRVISRQDFLFFVVICAPTEISSTVKSSEYISEIAKTKKNNKDKPPRLGTFLKVGYTKYQTHFKEKIDNYLIKYGGNSYGKYSLLIHKDNETFFSLRFF